MGLEQRPGQIAPQEFKLFTRREVLSAPVLPVAQEVFLSEEKKFEGEQPAEDLRRIVDEMSPDGFEPFVNPPANPDNLFINGYNGNFLKDMRLNRKQIERALTIAHLDGKVSLSSFNSVRTLSVEANPDGSITGRRFLFFGQKIVSEEQNPFHRVESVPTGWRIEVNDQRIMETLSEKGLSGEKLKREFIIHFNKFVNAGILEAVRREKLSSIKDENFRLKLCMSLFYSGWVSWGSAIDLISKQPSIWNFASVILKNYLIFYALPYAIVNLADLLGIGRKRDSPLEWFMPPIEIDKVARTYAFLNGKGRKLVK